MSNGLPKLNMTVKYFQFVDTKKVLFAKTPGLHTYIYTFCYFSGLPVGNLLTENKSFWSSECKSFK